MHEIKVEGAAVWFLVEGHKQHAWDEGDRQGNIRAAHAYLSAIGAQTVQVGMDGISGWYDIDTRAATVREDDLQQHLIDSFMVGEL